MWIPKMSLSEFVDEMPAWVRKWALVGAILILTLVTSAYIRTVNQSINKHVDFVNSIDNRVTTLESQVDSINTRSKDEFGKISRWMCFTDRTNALLAGMDCPTK